ncbi:MAG: glycosyltransferase family 2 protein [Chitinivibrionales bacterium]|nr:glycosyltransferase family 2 protein [Chitinivibrionales bacterium]
MTNTFTSIIVPVFNNLAFVKALYQSVLAVTPRGSYELVFVDNGSTESGLQAFYESIAGKNITVIYNEANLGFGRANNIAFKKSRGDYIALLNSDMLVTPGWLEALAARCIAHPDCGAVQAKILLVDDNDKTKWKTQTCGAKFNDDGMPVYHLNGHLADAPEVNTSFELQAFMGAGVLLKRSVIEKVGFFDESYDLVFMEDTDLSLRMSEAGYRIFFEPRSLLYHFHSASMPHLSQTEYDRSRISNADLFRQKWPKERITDVLKKQGL